jgi:hypothetical protein
MDQDRESPGISVDSSGLRLFRPTQPVVALGLAVDHLMRKSAFASLPFGEWSRVLVGQINRGHHVFAVDSAKRLSGRARRAEGETMSPLPSIASGSHHARVGQWRSSTAKRNAVVKPNSIMPFSASSAPIKPVLGQKDVGVAEGRHSAQRVEHG